MIKTMQTLQDVLVDGGIRIVNLKMKDFPRLLEIRNQLALDFDDSYQYTIAEKCRLSLVRFDTDFDKTVLGWKTPEEIMK